MLEDFISDIKKLYDRVINDEGPEFPGFTEKWNIKNSIGEMYQNLCSRELKKQMGSFYTPYEIVNFMVERAIEGISLKSNPFIKILDPSCGGGYFLISLFDHLVKKGREEEFENVEEHVLENNLYGFDIDENAVMITTLELYWRTGHVFKNIIKKDFLLDSEEKFDIIIGNPPYMGHKVLTGEYRDKLYQLFNEVFSDKGDISYCFIKKSIDSLRPDGRLLFFTSRYLLEALNGKNLRNYMKRAGTPSMIIDFYGVRVIKGAGVDNIIMEFSNSGREEKLDFFRLKYSAKGKGKEVFEDIKLRRGIHTKYIQTTKERLSDDGWIFLDKVEESILGKLNGVELGNICESFQGIITGCDKAFILSREEAARLKIEEDILRPWIKGRNVRPFNVISSNEVIIYSDLIYDENIYENAIDLIQGFRGRLESRRECKTGRRKWYELQWGRKPSVFDDEKIIYPYKASSNRFALDKGSYFSADVYAIKIREVFKKSISYDFLLALLNSRIFEFYVKLIAKKLGEDLYEYYPNKIMTLKVPMDIPELEKEVCKGGENLRERLDGVLVEYYGITMEEYEVIKSWCK